MLVLIGVLLVVLGFALRLNPFVVVTVAGIVTGFLGHLSVTAILNAFGNGFASSRSVTLFVLVLPVIGLIERFGLQEQGRLPDRPAERAHHRPSSSSSTSSSGRSAPPWASPRSTARRRWSAP